MFGKIITKLRAHPQLAVLLAVFLPLAITYSVITPIFEAGDEIWHYPYVQHLATGHSLPIQDPAVKTLWAQEGGQPPLYYALAALATFWVDTRDLPDRLWYNPHAKIGIPLLFGNKNMIVHTSAESFPWHGTALAVHLIRLLSILFSAGTIALTYFLALEILALPAIVPVAKRSGRASVTSDKTLASASAAFVAFNPMFIFITASVNNDSLAAMLAALVLLLLTRLLTRGATTRRFVALGIILGLAAITKASDLGLIVVAGVVFFMSLRRVLSAGEGRRSNLPVLSLRLLRLTGNNNTMQVIKGSFLSAALVIAIAGWWYLRNYLLYNDPLAFNVWVAVAGGRPAPATLATLLDEFQGLRISFWGNFGGVNVIAPEWVYAALDAMTVIAVIGLLIGLTHRALPRLLVLPAFWFALISVALVRWTMLTLASQGRLLFPAISAFAILFAYGLAQLKLANYTLRFAHYALLIPIVFLFGFSVLAPFTLIAPTYALPKRLSADTSVPNPTRIIFEDQVELVGYDLPQRSVQPGAELPITIYWRGVKSMAEDFSIYIHLFDASGNLMGQWDAYPGNGMYPTRLWRNEIIVDSYRVPIAGGARRPSVGRVEVGLYRKGTLKNLIARDPQGRAITPSITRFKIAGQSNVQVENPVRHEFENQIALVGSSIAQETRAGDRLQVRLYWRALAPMSEDYTVFVHLVDAQGKLIAQKDEQPQHGTYPTSFWDAGETVSDEYSVEIPGGVSPGEYRIQIGIYRASDSPRLIVNGGDHLDYAVRVLR